jgi:hypothetical protein
VGQQIGVASGGPFGTYASGGIALTFTDVLGNRMLGTSFGINGGFADISAQVIYVNRGVTLELGSVRKPRTLPQRIGRVRVRDPERPDRVRATSRSASADLSGGRRLHGVSVE